MYLSKSKSTKGVFYCYYRRQGSKSRTRVSCHTKKIREARKFLLEFEKNFESSKSSPPPITMGEFKIKYLGYIESFQTANSYRITKNVLTRFIEQVGSDTLIQNVSKEMAEKIIMEKYRQGHKYSAHLFLRTLKAAFNRGILWNHIENNSFRQIHLRLPTNSPAFINTDELNRIIQQESNPVLKLLYEFSFNTGLRISELLNLEWSDIDSKENIIKIINKENFTTKSKKGRIVPLNEKAQNILNQLFTNYKAIKTNYIFHLNERLLTPNWVSKKFKKCSRQAGMSEAIHLHGLRHSFASNLVQKGASIYVVKELLGHSNISVTQVYSHLCTQNLKDAVNLL